jgi:hypothetical protein
MNNEEPVGAPVENQIVSTDGKKLPEQTQVCVTAMPRQMNMTNLIYQWQPMGFRVVLNLPFVSDDQNYLFYIRNGPFIPLPPKDKSAGRDYADMVYGIGPGVPTLYPDTVSCFGYNNTRPVFLAGTTVAPFPNYDDSSKDFVITLTQYDLPPPIATFAMAFRRWRGDMQYRIRVVAGFVTQGYIIITPLKNVFVPIGIYNMFKFQPVIQRQDSSFRPSMLNSYALADTSLYRHVEATFPYDYPTYFYDQYQWLNRRISPSNQFDVKTPGGPFSIKNSWTSVNSEPHGENFLAVGVRGTLAATQPGAQIIFELEYRCVEGFQFADPFLPPPDMTQSTTIAKAGKYHLPVIIPSREFKTDGVGPVEPVAAPSRLERVTDPVRARLANVNLGVSSRRG